MEEIITINGLSYLVKYDTYPTEEMRLDVIKQLSPIATLDITTGLVAYLKFDSNTSDSSGNNNNGSLVGTPSYVPGKIGQAVSLDGVGQAVLIPSSPTTNIVNNISLAAWISPTLTGGTVNNRLFAKYIDASNSYQIAVHGTTGQILTRFMYNGVVKQYNTNQGMTANVMHHILITHSSGIIIVYIDGVPTTADTTGLPLLSTANDTSTDLQIGRMGTSWYLGTQVDEFREYNRVLSSTDATELKNYTGTLSGCAITKNVGDTVTLTASPSGGVAPYSIQFRKNGANIGTAGTSTTYAYVIQSTDGTSINFDAVITDSCSPTKQTCTTQTCTVTVVQPVVCGTPNCGFVVT